MAKTYAEQLDEVQTAITAILTGAQSYSIADRSSTRANLETLYDREKWLRQMVDREERGGIRVRGITPTG